MMTTNEALTSALIEIADELDKGSNSDINWLKYQGNVIRTAVTNLQEK
jgi:hypothetical protein